MIQPPSEPIAPKAPWLARLDWLPGILLVLGITATLYAWQREQRLDQARAMTLFTHQAEAVQSEIRARVAHLEELLRAERAFMIHAPEISREEWRRFVSSFDLDGAYSGIYGLGYVARVPAGQLAAFEARVRAELPAFRVFPKSDAALPAEHYVNLYLEPMNRVGRAIGFDIAVRADRREALERARDGDEMALTSRLRQLTPDSQGDDILAFLPVYLADRPIGTAGERRAALRGWVSASFSFRGLLSGVVAFSPNIDIDIFDGIEENAEAVVFDTHPENLTHSALYVIRKQMRIGGRQWSFRFSSTPPFERATESGRAVLVLAGGLVMSLVLGLAIHLLVAGRRQAMTLARDMTAALRDEKNFVGTVMDSSTALTVVLDEAGVIRRASVAAQEAAGVGEVELLGHAFSRFFAPPRQQSLLDHAIAECRLHGRTTALEAEIDHAQRKRHISWTFAPLSGGSGPSQIVATGLDITERRQAEDRLRHERNLFVGGPVVVFRWLAREGWPVAYVSPNVSQFGIRAEDLLSGRLPFTRLVHPDDIERVAGEVQAHTRENRSNFEQEYRLVRPDGAVLSIYDFTTIERDSSGAVESYLGYVIDVTAHKAADEHHRRSETRFANVIATSAEGYWEVDIAGNTTAANPAFCRLLGYAEAEILGRPGLGLTAPGGDAVMRNQLALRLSKPNRRYEIELRRKDGGIVPCRVSATSLFDSNGVLIGSFALVSDISAEKEATEAIRRQEQRLRQILESVPSAIVLSRPESGLILHVNQAAQDLFYARFDQLVGQAPQTLYVDPNDRRRFVDLVLAQGKCDNFEARFKRLDGSLFWALMSTRLFDFEGERALLTAFLDITPRKQVEEKAAELAEELRRSNAELEQFAYVASHDLQEPLRMVASYVQLLERRYREKLDDEAREFIDYAVDGATRMQRLINDLLDYSRVSRKGKPLAPVELSPVVREAVVNLAGLIEECGAEIDIGPLPQVLADEAQMTSLFQNLIGNAIKYRKPERRPKVTVSAERQGEFWAIAVADNGIGIAPQFFGRIFVLFQRLHTRREYPGTGIGLALCKKIVERHGGQIRVESEVGEGSRFIVSLPGKV
ncbi:MAG: PAS domain S-box protein [Rhodospirillales bacterium]|nr:PAS domain S-box protein [Rhodospirillales bacterium]